MRLPIDTGTVKFAAAGPVELSTTTRLRRGSRCERNFSEWRVWPDPRKLSHLTLTPETGPRL